jgi:hypothetical protein
MGSATIIHSSYLPALITRGWFLKRVAMLPELTDQSLMPFGAFRGHKLANVPAWYLLKIKDEAYVFANLKKYIEDNKDILEAERKRANQAMRR